MNDRRPDDRNDREPHDRDDLDRRGGPQGEADGERERRDGGGPDTRFLQLEMSRVLYAEAEAVAKPAFRELLLEAAKDHLRARFGDTITRLAQMAVDELLTDIEASLDIESKIQRRHESGGTDDRLREALARTRSEQGGRSAERKQGRASASRRRRR